MNPPIRVYDGELLYVKWTDTSQVQVHRDALWHLSAEGEETCSEKWLMSITKHQYVTTNKYKTCILFREERHSSREDHVSEEILTYVNIEHAQPSVLSLISFTGHHNPNFPWARVCLHLTWLQMPAVTSVFNHHCYSTVKYLSGKIILNAQFPNIGTENGWTPSDWCNVRMASSLNQ